MGNIGQCKKKLKRKEPRKGVAQVLALVSFDRKNITETVELRPVVQLCE